MLFMVSGNIAESSSRRETGGEAYTSSNGDGGSGRGLNVGVHERSPMLAASPASDCP